jgi:hypothetical protein
VPLPNQAGRIVRFCVHAKTHGIARREPRKSALAGLGLYVYIRCSVAYCLLQNRAHQPDDGSLVGACTHPELQLPEVLLYGFLAGLLEELRDVLGHREELVEDALNLFIDGDHRRYGVAGDHHEVFEGVDVGWVAHRHHETPVLYPQRHYPVLAQDLLFDE